MRVWTFSVLAVAGACSGAAAQQAVTGFTLIDADADVAIPAHDPLLDGATLNRWALPTRNLNVRANTDPPTVGSVRFGLDGDPNYRTENSPPYALAGDSSGDYNAWTPGLGGHTLTATPYAESGGGGVPGAPLSIGFTVVDEPGNYPPAADAGSDRALVLPDDALTLHGAGSDPDGVVAAYAWTQESGPPATMTGVDTPDLGLADLVEGTYVFRLTVTDDQGATGHDEATVTVLSAPPPGGVVSGELKRWHKVTVTFTGPATDEAASPNPFRDRRLEVTFVSPTGLALKVPGYYAADGTAAETGATGGTAWRAHLAPHEEGLWTYVAAFRAGTDVALSDDPDAGTPDAFDGAGGTFLVGPTDKTGRDHRGKGLLEYVGERYLRFAGTGERFLKGGADSPENFLAYHEFDGTYDTGGRISGFLHEYAPHVADWSPGDPTWHGTKGKGIIGALNYLASKGMNSVYFLTYNIDGGDGADVWPWTSDAERTRFDCSKLDQWEVVFEHMDRLGILLHVVTQETENDQGLDGGALGTQRTLYYRELIARFAHHPAVVWNLGEENSNTDAQRKAFARYFKDHDPYDHPVVVHTYPGAKESVYAPLLGYPYFDGPSLQGGDHGTVLEWVTRPADAGRPWVVCYDEQGPASTGVKPDADDPDHDAIRKDVLWATLTAGGGGCEWYFGYNYPHSDMDCEDWRSRDHMWDLTRYALEFFGGYVPLAETEPADPLVSAAGAQCLAKAGHVYAIYLPGGGTTDLELPDVTLEVKWYNPRSGGGLLEGTVARVSGPGPVGIGLPPADTSEDWAALVRRRPGDADGDGAVDINDFFTLSANWDPGATGRTWAQGDFDGDRDVDIDDFFILSGNWDG